MRLAAAVVMLAGTSVIADTDIHRCLLDDGTVAFQETPCPEPLPDVNDDREADKGDPDTGSAAAQDDFFDFVNPFDESEEPQLPPEATLPQPVSQDRAECEKTARDAIDAIDLEMRETAYTKEQGQEYLADLLRLTRQLRACKQL